MLLNGLSPKRLFIGLGLAGLSSSVSKTVPWVGVSFVINLLLRPLFWENGKAGENASEFSCIHTMKYHRKLFSVLYNKTNLVSEHIVLNNSC